MNPFDVLPFLVLLPIPVVIGSVLWRSWLSPRARARAKAYDRGAADVLAGVGNWHTSPFLADFLASAYRDGVEDARLALHRLDEERAFKRDKQILG